MASNGLESTAKSGKCRICQRVRNTAKYLKAVGEVRHGYATGHIWECKDKEDCQVVAERKLYDSKVPDWNKDRIRAALKIGRYKEYIVFP